MTGLQMLKVITIKYSIVQIRKAIKDTSRHLIQIKGILKVVTTAGKHRTLKSLTGSRNTKYHLKTATFGPYLCGPK